MRILLLLLISSFGQCFLTNSKRNIIQSLLHELKIKHSIIIKDLDFRPDIKIINFVKELSQQEIYSSFLTVHEINNSMHIYYEKSRDYYTDPNAYKFEHVLDKRRANLKYPPKTLNLVKDFNGETNQLFKVNNEYEVSRFTWLILSNFNDTLITLNDLYIPYSCQFFRIKNSSEDQIIEEIYHPSLHRYYLLKRQFGTWKRNEALKIFELNFSNRRLNMNGTSLTAVYFKNNEGATYFCNEIMQEISRVMNFKWILVSDADYYTYYYKTGQEMIYEMVFSVGMRSYQNFRPSLMWLWPKPIHMYISYDKNLEQSGISIFLSPFSFNLWIIITTGLIISGISLILFQYLTWKLVKKDHNLRNYFVNYFYEPLELFFNQCENDNAITSSLRIATISISFAILFIIPAYTGSILSHILLPQVSMPFNNIKEFVNDGTYKLLYFNNSIEDIWLKMSNDIYIKKAFEKFSTVRDGNLDNQLKSAANEMCRNNKLALVFTQFDVSKAPCRLVKISDPLFSAWIAMGLRYNSPYENIFNRLLKSIQSTGVMKRMLSDLAAFNFNETKLQLRYNTDNSVNISSVKSLFIIIGILYSIAFGILITELIHYYVRKKLRKPKIIYKK